MQLMNTINAVHDDSAREALQALRKATLEATSIIDENVAQAVGQIEGLRNQVASLLARVEQLERSR